MGHIGLARQGERKRPCVETLSVFSVAQSCTLPYCRFVICVASQRANAWDWYDTLPNIIRRYGRLKICATRRATALN